MAKQSVRQTEENGPLIAHGAEDLPAVAVASYSLEIRDKAGFVGDRANKGAFRRLLDDWRKRARKGGEDPLGDTATDDLSKKEIDAFLKDEETTAAALVRAAVDDLGEALAETLARYLQDNAWKGVKTIAVGGGFRDSKAGLMAIARAQLLLRAEGLKVTLAAIANHPDEAGLLGAVHLVPAWMLKGHDAILAVDIGGTNIRAGVVKLGNEPDFSEAKVWKSALWRHADDEPRRTATIDYLVQLIEGLIGKAEKAGVGLAPVIGVGCPGIIATDGSIARGGQNLPGGNWESTHFNLPEALRKAIPRIADQPTFIIMHNDAVVQGLSELPRMKDAKAWAAVTIGTGLGNVSFTNKET